MGGASSSTRLLRRAPYDGKTLGIVIGIDVGTTYSGVSYAILRPGEVPDIVSVPKFSDQLVTGSKIPSVIFYDQELQIKAIGPQTTLESTLADAESEDWIKVEYFKLHLCPPGLRAQTSDLVVCDLPKGKTAEDVLGDFLRYLYEETASFIKTSHVDGQNLWDAVKDRSIFILGHPNGWKGVPQQRYRISAIKGGLITDSVEDRNRLRFVTEGEASALSCLSSGLGPSTLKAGFRFVVADAGGGTVDVSTFEVSQVIPLQLKECAPPEGRAAGSVFVNMSTKHYLQGKLRGSKYDDEMLLRDILENFEAKTKREFKGIEEESYLRIGDRRVKDAALGIKSGFMKLDIETMVALFSRSLSGLVDAIDHQLNESKSDRNSTPVWLVGGFGSSPYLLTALRSAPRLNGVTIQTPDSNTAKAVANGAVLHYVDETVKSRMVDSNYGTTALIPFNPLLEEHRERMSMTRSDPEGVFIGPLFSCIAIKSTPVLVDQSFSKKYYREILTKQSAKNFSTELLCYDGDPPVPKWYEENIERIREVCILRADLSELCNESTLVQSQVALGPLKFETMRSYWRVEFEIDLKFGTTALEAAVTWDMNGKRKSGPVEIIYTSHNT